MSRSAYWQLRGRIGKLHDPVLHHVVLFGAHAFENDAHAGDPETSAGMFVNHLAVEFAGNHAVAHVEVHFGPQRQGLGSVDVTAARAEFGKLAAKRFAIVKNQFGFCGERIARVGATDCVGNFGSFGHGTPPVSCQTSEVYFRAKGTDGDRLHLYVC
jgi:hypothetical protein